MPLARLGVAPRTGPTDVDSLVTDGFFEAVYANRIDLRGHVDVQRLMTYDGPAVALSDGSVVAADVVVAATGQDQDPGPFSAEVQRRLLNDDGGLDLFQAVLPERVERLAYIGWMHSFRSPTGAELQAIQLAAAMGGLRRTPPRPQGARDVERFWLTRSRATARGQQQIPKNASITDLDRLIQDFSGLLPASVRLREWTAPLDPAAYAGLLPALVRRLSAVPSDSTVTV